MQRNVLRSWLIVQIVVGLGSVIIAQGLQHDHADKRPLSALHDQDLPSDYNEARFRRRVSKAIMSARKILDTTRKPTYADEIPHLYDDKYSLSEFLTATSLAAQLNILESLGMGRAELSRLVQSAAERRTITMRLQVNESTVASHQATRDVGDGRVHKQSSSLFGSSESQVVTRVTEYFWRHEVAYELIVFTGSDSSARNAMRLSTRTAHAELVTINTAEAPLPLQRRVPPVDAELTWLLQQLDVTSDGSFQIRFRIHRNASTCRTPRRNEQVEQALASASALHHWATAVHNYFAAVARRVDQFRGGGPRRGHALSLDLGSIAEHADALFVPLLPLFVGLPANSTNAPARGTVPRSDARPLAHESAGLASVEERTCAAPLLPRLDEVHAILSEERRSLHEVAARLEATFPSASDETTLISAAEAKLCVWSRHLRDVLAQWSDGVDYIEDMLHKQLVSAVGRELTPRDFARFMVQHEQRLYATPYVPQPFTFAVRRPHHSPEGLVAIEGHAAAADVAGEMDPIRTVSRRLTSAADTEPMSFALSAAVRVTFGGERHVHAYLAHQFDEQDAAPLRLSAHARQFSCFILLLGRVGPARTFEPSHAVLIKDKDELTISLMLETLPTPKAFRDAISSLSPEQQRFARAVRRMQLEGSVFGLLILQLKPQLERLLRLTERSLTKEIALTQAILDLFIL